MNSLQAYAEGRFQSEKVILTHKQILEMFNDTFVAVGSRSLGVHTADSDYDYVCTLKDAGTFWHNKDSLSIYREITNEGYDDNLLLNDANIKFYTAEGDCINLIAYEDVEDVKKFSDVKEFLLAKYSIEELHNRENRCKGFQSFIKRKVKEAQDGITSK